MLAASRGGKTAAAAAASNVALSCKMLFAGASVSLPQPSPASGAYKTVTVWAHLSRGAPTATRCSPVPLPANPSRQPAPWRAVEESPAPFQPRQRSTSTLLSRQPSRSLGTWRMPQSTCGTTSSPGLGPPPTCRPSCRPPTPCDAHWEGSCLPPTAAGGACGSREAQLYLPPPPPPPPPRRNGFSHLHSRRSWTAAAAWSSPAW